MICDMLRAGRGVQHTFVDPKVTAKAMLANEEFLRCLCVSHRCDRGRRDLRLRLNASAISSVVFSSRIMRNISNLRGESDSKARSRIAGPCHQNEDCRGICMRKNRSWFWRLPSNHVLRCQSAIGCFAGLDLDGWGDRYRSRGEARGRFPAMPRRPNAHPASPDAP